VTTCDADLLVVGAGPHALAACAYLLDAPGRTPRLLAVDPRGWVRMAAERIAASLGRGAVPQYPAPSGVTPPSPPRPPP
jgi:thioredoxin reductase